MCALGFYVSHGMQNLFFELLICKNVITEFSIKKQDKPRTIDCKRLTCSDP